MRCFIALELNNAIKDQLQAAQAHFKNIGGKVTWCGRNQMHLTLQFLGEVADDLIPKICDAMNLAAEEVPPFEFTVEKIGAFPPKGQPRVLWAGVSDCPPLLKLQQRLETYLKPLGFKPEDRDFTPHLTLGRVRERIDLPKYIAVQKELFNFQAGTQKSEKLILFSSTIRPTGSVYTIVNEVSLGK
jgi:2'-5' RNA ligase